jgi:hypothetical protein
MGMSCFSVICSAFVVGMLAQTPALAAGAVDGGYIRSLAAAGKVVLVVEYYDGNRIVVARKGYASTSGFSATSPTIFKVDEAMSLNLFGLEPCNGEMVNQKEGFAGDCAGYAKEQLSIKLKAAKVILCRAFLTEEKAAVQDATCFAYYNYPGALDTVDNLEEQLVSLGALRLARKADGTALRPDLVPAERIGQGGFGMWADPRVKEQRK